ncbi:F-box protein At5g39450 isoform X1 [Nymphaea colorata]|nr:F-box protein At5g39450 isoform X1 [Nymphaea colorata]
MTCILPGSSYSAAMSPDCGRILGHGIDPDMNCGSSLLLALPEDVLALVSGLLNPVDLCNLSLCCRSLNGLAASDKVWFMQCEKLGLIDAHDFISWRKVVDSYKAICRFLVKVKPLIGIWVHQNPELGNVVYVMWGFMSVVACRVIPQELGPLGFDGPLLWAPVFEIIGDSDGSPLFFLHGRERDKDYCYPGSLKAIDDRCNVLLLEAAPQKNITTHAVRATIDDLGTDSSRRICRSEESRSMSHRVAEGNDSVPFSRLAFGDRRRLLEIVADHVRLEMPASASHPLFPRSRDALAVEDELVMEKETIKEDMVMLAERRSLLIQMYRTGNVGEGQASSSSSKETVQLGSCIRGQCNTAGLSKGSWDKMAIDSGREQRVRNNLDCSITQHLSFDGRENSQNTKKRTIAGYFRDGFKQIIGKATGGSNGSIILKNGSSSSESKHVQLHEFLRSGSSVGLSLHASTMKLSTYRAWPIMHDNRFALYKLPQPLPVEGQEYAGLWGGTFGWPPGRPAEDKPGKALFFLLLSYEESDEGKYLIATKILEGTHYVLHPNGSAMFIVNINEPSSDPFPWETDRDSLPLVITQTYHGEGIANGYGFRYPGSKPGALFTLQSGLLAFVWRETRAVLTLQRLNLRALLGRGERVAALPPVANFAYLTKSYSNVFAGFAGTHSLSFPR